MKKLILSFFIFLLINLVSAEDYKVFDDITLNSLDNKELDSFANCKILSYSYNETNESSILKFEIQNNNNYSITATVWDVYSKKKHRLKIEPGTHIYEFENPKLKFGKFFFAFIKGDEFALVKENIQVMTLPDQVYIASKDAINWFSYKKALFCLGLFMVGLITTKEYLIKKLLYFRVKEAKLFILASILIFSILLLWCNYGSDYNTWDLRLLISYYNWFYYVFIIVGFIAGFKLFSPGLKRLLLFDFEKWSIKLFRMPYNVEEDKLRVKWLDGRYYELKLNDDTNEFRFFDNLLYDEGKINIITKYSKYVPQKPEYEGFWRVLISKIDNFILSIKEKFGKIRGHIEIEKSCIMTKEVSECLFLNDSLEKLNNKLYELYYKIAELKNIRGVDVVNVSQTATDIILRDLSPENSDLVISSIKDMIDDEKNYLKGKGIGEDNGTYGTGNEETGGDANES